MRKLAATAVLIPVLALAALAATDPDSGNAETPAVVRVASPPVADVAAAAFETAAVPETLRRQPHLPFEAEAFAAAQSEGRPILIEVHAPWCSTCRFQRGVIEELAHDDDLADLVVFAVDFDTDKETLRSLDARQQSTLVGFVGAIEIARGVGVSDRPSIVELAHTLVALSRQEAEPTLADGEIVEAADVPTAGDAR